MKKIYAILGFGLATGVVTYTILNAFRNSKKEQRRENGEAAREEYDKPKGEASVVVSNTATEENHTAFVKHTVASDITARHEEATQIMNDALNAIYKKTEVSEDNSDKLDRISKELDNLLQEGD